MVFSGKKLLVLDINGLLLDTYFQSELRPDRPHDAKVNRFYVYKRPLCEEFIQFCFQNFIVGVWSSAREHNVLSLVEFMFKEDKEKLAFIWHQQHCTDTGFRHPDNKFKPVFLKELSRLWKNFEPDLPWEEGDYGPSNTLLIDDSAYKAINNPQHTAIFPKTYKATDPQDDYLGGELRNYLEGLIETKDVQQYLENNPFGEPSITVTDPQWSQFFSMFSKGNFKDEEEPLVPAHLMHITGPIVSDSIPSRQRKVESKLIQNGGMVLLMDGESESQQFAGRRNKRRHSDHISPQDWNYDGGRYAAHQLVNNVDWGDVGPSWSPQTLVNETGQGLPSESWNSERHCQVQPIGWPSDSANIGRGGGGHYDYDQSQKRHHRKRSYKGDETRVTGLDSKKNGTRDQEDSHKGDGTKRRRRDEARELTGMSIDEDCVIQTRDKSRPREHEVYREARNQEDAHKGDGRRQRHRDGTREPKGIDMDEDCEIHKRDQGRAREPEEVYRATRDQDDARRGNMTRKRHQERARERKDMGLDEDCEIQTQDRSRARESKDHYSCEHRASRGHDHREEERHGRSKSREGRELQRRANKEHAHKRDISEGSSRHIHRHGQHGNGNQSRSRY